MILSFILIFPHHFFAVTSSLLFASRLCFHILFNSSLYTLILIRNFINSLTATSRLISLHLFGYATHPFVGSSIPGKVKRFSLSVQHPNYLYVSHKLTYIEHCASSPGQSGRSVTDDNSSPSSVEAKEKSADR